MHPYTYRVTLRASHPSIEPEAITAAFGMPPVRTWRAGDPRSTPSGAPLAGRYKETYWYTCLVARGKGASEDCDFEHKLSSLLDELEKHAEFIATLRAGGGRATLFVGLFGDSNFGFELPARITRRLGAIGLDLSLDIYPGSAGVESNETA